MNYGIRLLYFLTFGDTNVTPGVSYVANIQKLFTNGSLTSFGVLSDAKSAL